MFGTKYLNDEHDCNVVSTNSLNIHDANDMQSHKLGDDIFCPQAWGCLLLMMIILIKVGLEECQL